MRKILKKINWGKGGGLIPAIIQNSKTGEVLMLGYMSEESLKKTLNTGNVWFFSRSKKRLWMKGEVSGNILRFVDCKIDCDADSLLILVDSVGVTCHTGSKSCFGDGGLEVGSFFDPIIGLFELIEGRKLKKPVDSYTVKLLEKGVDKICSKIGEESGEVIKAAQKETKKRLIEESVDLFYHMLVLLVSKNVKLVQFFTEIENRKK